MRLAIVVLALGLAGLLLADGVITGPNSWAPAPAAVEAPSFQAPTSPVDDHEPGHTHQELDREWCWVSIGDTDGDGYTEQVPCDPETRAAARAALDGLHDDDRDRLRVAP